MELDDQARELKLSAIVAYTASASLCFRISAGISETSKIPIAQIVSLPRLQNFVRLPDVLRGQRALVSNNAYI